MLTSDYSGPQPFSMCFPIRLSHTDPAGFVFFSRYFEMFQALAEEWFENCLDTDFADMITNQRIGQPTVHTECQFIKPCVLGDKLDLALILEKMGKSSLSIRFIGSVDGEVRLRARSVQVILSMEEGRAVAIDDRMRSRMQTYIDHVEPPDEIGPEARA